MKQHYAFALLAALLAFTTTLLAQSDLEKQLQSISGSAGRSYVAPIVNGFGANINGGWFHGAPKATMLGIDVQIGVVFMGAPFKDDEKTFSTSGTFRFSQSEAATIVSQTPGIPAAVQPTIIQQISSKDYTVQIAGPTATGTPYDAANPSHSNQIYVTFPGDQFTVNGQTYTVGAFDQGQGVGGVEQLQKISILPLAVPQLTLGTVYGTEATIRYLPAVNLTGSIGKVKYFGFGLQHNLAMWIPNPPLDVSLSFFTQKMTIDPYVEAKGTAFGLTGSKRFGYGLLTVTPYAGVALEKSTLTFTYNQVGSFIVDNIAVNNIPIQFDVDGANKARFTVGANFKLIFFNLNADYNFGTYKSFTAGLMFTF